MQIIRRWRFQRVSFRHAQQSARGRIGKRRIFKSAHHMHEGIGRAHLSQSLRTETFAAGFDELTWRPARIPVVSSLTGELLKNTPALRDFTARHPSTPIHWEQVLATLDRQGIRILYECGPGISLTQNGRFVSFDAAYINVKKVDRWCPA